MRYLWLLLIAAGSVFAARADDSKLYDRDNLTAWCIVPFDARKRGPEERADMLRRLGFTRFAYDWRGEHIAEFDEEMETLKRFGITLQAFWFPGALNDEARTILDLLKRHNLHTELWVVADCGPVEPLTPEQQAARVAKGADAIRPIAEAAGAIGCKVGLYNHDGWFGEPENMIAIVEALKLPNVGIVYNFHHGHQHMGRYAAALRAMLPHLYSVNLNGMSPGSEAGGIIMPFGQGTLDLEIMRTIRDIGYKGPIGILGHTMNDAEATLRDNLDGLDWLVPQLNGAPPPGPRPVPRSMRAAAGMGVPSLSPEFGKALKGGMLLPGKPEFRTPPLTAECRAKIDSAASFNILLASDPKSSGAHWEVYTFAGSGHLTVYLPGMEPQQVESKRNICDGKWHTVAFGYEATRGRLWLDGELLADTPLKSKGQPGRDGGFAVGRLVEGELGCDGLIDDVRVSKGIRESPPQSQLPLQADAHTIALLTFDELTASAVDPEAWEVEDASRRASMPTEYVIPAARTEDLAGNIKAQSTAKPGDWPRSHGGNDSARWSPLDQINKSNIAHLKQAWVYHSGDGAANIQCNPVIVDGVIYAPTAGDRIVALDGATGRELWGFKPGGPRPAQRGLVYWDGGAKSTPRLLVNAGDQLWAIDPKTGAPITDFGEAGKLTTGPVVVAGAVWNGIFIYPGLLGGVFGIDAATGKRLWTFDTLPQTNEPAAATWNPVRGGANCWGGMALDGLRGIAYLATGSPKPNFFGEGSDGRNLYANCVIALDAATGKLRWHFQDLRHDIWDLDLAAPPTLVTVTREGRRVDAVAQTTKTGNTYLLDRESGAPLFPIRMKRAPASTLPGERTWPYQPAPELPEPFTRQVFTADDITTRSEEAHDYIEGRVKAAAFGWMEPLREGKPTIFYGIHGGAEWTGASFDPSSERLYVSANEFPWNIALFQPDEPARDPKAPPTHGDELYQVNCAKCHGADRIGLGMAPPLVGLRRRMKPDEAATILEKGRNVMPAASEIPEADRKAILDFIFLLDRPESQREQPKPTRPAFVSNGYPKLLDHEGYPGNRPPWGTLNCIDLKTGRIAWKVPLGEYPDLVEQGITGTGSENFGGAMATAGGLVFCAGTPDKKIRAFDADTGKELWQAQLPNGAYAPPATYLAGGKQYVVIAATGGGKLGGELGDAWVAFKLE